MNGAERNIHHFIILLWCGGQKSVLLRNWKELRLLMWFKWHCRTAWNMFVILPLLLPESSTCCGHKIYLDGNRKAKSVVIIHLTRYLSLSDFCHLSAGCAMQYLISRYDSRVSVRDITYINRQMRGHTRFLLIIIIIKLLKSPFVYTSL